MSWFLFALALAAAILVFFTPSLALGACLIVASLLLTLSATMSMLSAHYDRAQSHR